MHRALLALALVGVAALALGVWLRSSTARQSAVTAEGALESTDHRTPQLAAAGSADRSREAADDPAAGVATTPPGEALRAPPPEPEAAAVSGVVRDGRGQPLRGAVVEARVDTTTGRSEWSDRPSYGRVVDRDETNDEGRFLLRTRGPWRVAVSASADGRATARVPGCSPGDELEIVLAAGATLEGLVSAGGSPVAGALVRVHHGHDQDELREERTDAAGRFRVDGLHGPAAGLLVAPLDHSMSRWREVALEPGRTTRVEVEVEPGWAVGGRVVDRATRAPVPGARVSAWSFHGKNTVADAQGRFRIAGVRERPGTLVAIAPGFGRTEVRYEGPRDDLDLALIAGRRVVGTVHDAESPSTVPAGTVVVAALESDGRLSRQEWQAAELSATGAFEFECVRRDLPAAVQVRAAGYGAVVVPVPDPVDGVSSVGRIELSSQSLLAGTVWRSDESPAVGATVTLRGPREADLDAGANFYFGNAQDHTDRRGRFFLPGLVPGTYDLHVHLAGGRALDLELTLSPGEERKGLELLLPGGTPFGGRVVDAEGRGVPGAFVMLFPDMERPGPILADQCDDAGMFTIEDVPPGSFTVRVTGPEPATEGDPLYLPTVEKGYVANGALVELSLDRLDARVSGRVVDTDGTAAPNVYVCVSLGAQETPWNGVLTGIEGEFELPVRSAGPTVLLAWRTRPLDGSSELRASEWQIGRHILDEDGDAGRARVDEGASTVTLRLR